MTPDLIRGDAFQLPFCGESFTVVVCDPPYDGRNRGKKGVGYKQAGYVPFAGRSWWYEAWRVLKPSGHLYVFAAIREQRAWHREIEEPAVDTIAWFAPNSPSVSAFWRRGIGGRAPAWRPILHWQKPPPVPIPWEGVYEGRLHPITGKQMFSGPGVYVDPNVFVTAAIQSNMHEAEEWPNQLPVKLLTWLLRPHKGALVLDLFSGTGTTREAAAGLGLRYVSVELAPQAIALIRDRPLQSGRVVAEGRD